MSNYEKITLNTWQYANTTVTGCIAGSEWLTRGYTGHEHMDEFGIINMNARMYDPLLGRMLSPDKYVQDATSIQNFNRYTYALNNPLKYTDPDGNLVFGLPLFFGGITAFIATGSTMIMTGYSPSQAFNVAATIAVTVATAGITSSIAASGLFGNTSVIIFGSMVSSGTSFAASGGKSDLSVSFGAASYSFSRNEFGYIGKDVNSGWQNFGYVLGALANLSDIITYADYITSVKRALNPISGLTEEELIRIYNEDTDTWLNNIILGGKANYAGNSPANISPTEFLTYKSLTPLDGVERIQKSGDIFGGYLHDLTYFEKGTDGIRGVLFNTNVLAADKALISGMTTLIRSGKYAGFVREANLIRNVFRVTVGIKQSYSYSYLLNLSKP